MLDNLSANHSSTDVEWCNQTTTQSTGVIQQQNSFNRRKYSFWSSLESWPQPNWDGLAWPQENNSHQTSQEYCSAEKRGVPQNSSWPLSRIDLQMQEALVSLVCLYNDQRRLLSNCFEQVTTSFQNMLPKKTSLKKCGWSFQTLFRLLFPVHMGISLAKINCKVDHLTISSLLPMSCWLK